MRVRTRKRRWRKVGELFFESRIVYNPKWMSGPEPFGTANPSDLPGGHRSRVHLGLSDNWRECVCSGMLPLPTTSGCAKPSLPTRGLI